jgi:hypothetical protein
MVLSKIPDIATPVMGWRWRRIGQGFRDADKHRRDDASRCFEGVRNTFEGARMRGISVPPGGVGRRPQTKCLGRLRQAKTQGKQSLLGIGCDHENSVKNHYFMKMTTNKCILDDFRHKNYQKQSVESLKVVFLTPKRPL